MIKATIRGLPDLREALAGIVPKLRRRALRNALAAGARIVQRTAIGRAPVLKASTYAGASALRRGVRSIGTLRRSISVRTSRMARMRGDVGVFVNVRPAKAGKRGARSPHDPYYWRWVNFGWRPARGQGMKPGAGFLEAGAGRLQDALREFYRVIGPAIAKLNRPKAPPP